MAGGSRLQDGARGRFSNINQPSDVARLCGPDAGLAGGARAIVLNQPEGRAGAAVTSRLMANVDLSGLRSR